MLFCKYVNIGDRIEILENSGEKNILHSQVEDIPKLGELLIRMPIINGRYAIMPDNSELSIIIFTEKGMFKFCVCVAGNLKKDGFGLLHIKISNDGERIQRRDFYRLSCETAFCFKQVFNCSEPFESENALTGIILDISGGGLRFICNCELRENALIKGIVKLNNEYALIAGKVLDTKKLVNESNEYKFQCRVQFLVLSQEVMKKIMKYIFDEQRKQLQRR